MSGESETTIDSTFRNGSITAIGVVVGFSLGFFGRWAALPGQWSPSDLAAVAAITIGIVLQTLSLALLLHIDCLHVPKYVRAIRLFILGLVLVGTGVVLAVFASILGFGSGALGA